MILHNFPPYIKRPSVFTFDEVDMSLATISFSVMLDAQVNPDFQLDWAVEFRGRMFTLQTLLPSGIKDNTTMRYKYDLIFKSEEVELSYYPFLNMVALDSGDKLPNQSTFAFQGNVIEFIDRFNLNLQYYLGGKWGIAYVGGGDVSTTTKIVSVDNSSLWDMLTQLYDLYGIRWSINGHMIEVGALAEEVEHVFEYGSEHGLYSIQRTNPNDNIYTRLIGQGGNRNMPLTYFKTDDPDTNNIIKSMHFTGIMPKGYRDYIRGWNAGVVKPTETVEYNQGATDKISGRKMQPINYVERNVDKWGVRYGSIQSNPDIYPTIQGMERAGLGRVDEIVAVEAVTEDDPENENFSDYFNIWIKDIGFDLRDPKYWVTERMKMMFSDGMLAGEDYEFELVAEEMGDGSLKPYIYPDTSKSYNGVQSAWRIQLLKSEAELTASGRYLPNKMQNAKAGDHFFLINIALPHEYVLQAEQRVTNWLNEEIVKTSDEFPTYTIKPSAIFMERFDEASKMKAGAKIRIADDRLVGDTYLPIYIQSMRLDYRDGKALPNIELTVSDKVVATRNPIELLQSAVQTLSSGAYSTQQIAELAKQFERFFLRKDMPDIAKRMIGFLQGLNIGDFSSGFLGGGGTFRMQDGVSVLEVDQLLVRMRAEFFSVLIHNAKHIGGELVMSPAEMMCIKVEETPTFYRCYFDTDGGKVINLFTNKDFARCQIFTGATQKFYWRKVVAVGVDYIELSKTDMVAGSDVPEIGDNIFQLGSLDPERQSAMIFSTVGYDAPSFKQYKDIDSMSLEGKDYTVFSGKGNKIVGKTVFMSDGKNVEDKIDNINVGATNLLLNTGFLGDFQAKNIDEITDLISDTDLGTNPLVHWVHDNAKVIDAPSRSGKGALIGNIKQTVNLLANQDYIFTVWAKGHQMNVSLDGTQSQNLTDEYQKYVFRFKPTQTKAYTFEIDGTAVSVYELMLSEGTNIASYNFAPEDDLKAVEQLKAIGMITDAIKEYDTSILGGLILTSMLQLGKYKDGKMQQVNAGVNGIYNNDNDPAFWAGGTLDDAIRTMTRIKNNPTDITDEEWKSLANIVLSHGGDGVFRGFIYALGGIFRGRVETNVAGNRIIIDPESNKIEAIDTNDKVRFKISFDPDGSASVRVFTESEHFSTETYVGAHEIKMSYSDNEGNIHSSQLTHESVNFFGVNMDYDTLEFVDKFKFSANYNVLTNLLHIEAFPMAKTGSGLPKGSWYVDNGHIKIVE